MHLNIRVLNESERVAAFSILQELRTELSYSEFQDIFEKASIADDYSLVGYVDEGSVIAVMGMRILHDLVHGKHLYVDDLVTHKGYRSRGIGSALLQYAESEAKRLGCRLLRLSTGSDNERGRHFYEREGWALRSVTYKKPIEGESLSFLIVENAFQEEVKEI